jgi:16S rRNA (guanine527-N7)-methyltransferase
MPEAKKPVFDPQSSMQALQQAAVRLQVSLSEAQMRALLAYLQLIVKWNKVYNLTAVRNPAEMLTHHILDSLAIIAPLQRQTSGSAIKLLDVGAGAGLPGVVIAICCPDIQVTCVDAVAKKMAFVQQVATELKLPNLKAQHARVESMVEKYGVQYDVITSRAFATLLDFVTGSRAALQPVSGVWLAMKAKDTSAEVAALPADVAVFHVEQLVVPGLDAERCIVWMRPN